MDRHFRLGVFLGIVSLFALANARVFAGDATLSATSDVIGQQLVPAVSRAKEPVLAGSASTAGIPEPGVLALLGFGLVLLGLAYTRTRGSSLSKPVQPIGKGGSHYKDSYTRR